MPSVKPMLFELHRNRAAPISRKQLANEVRAGMHKRLDETMTEAWCVPVTRRQAAAALPQIIVHVPNIPPLAGVKHTEGSLQPQRRRRYRLPPPAPQLTRDRSPVCCADAACSQQRRRPVPSCGWRLRTGCGGAACQLRRRRAMLSRGWSPP